MIEAKTVTSKRESMRELRTCIEDIDRALSHGEWWLTQTRDEPRLAVTRIRGDSLTKAQKADRDAFVQHRMLTRKNRRHNQSLMLA